MTIEPKLMSDTQLDYLRELLPVMGSETALMLLAHILALTAAHEADRAEAMLTVETLKEQLAEVAGAAVQMQERVAELESELARYKDQMPRHEERIRARAEEVTVEAIAAWLRSQDDIEATQAAETIEAGHRAGAGRPK